MVTISSDLNKHKQTRAFLMGQTIGYIRVSTIAQNTDRQLDGVALDRIFEEHASAKTMTRPKLEEMLEFVREGDTVIVHDISRLARNIRDLHDLVERITKLGVTLKFYKEGLIFTGDKHDPMSNLLLSMLGAVYQFERSILLERQKEGIAAAKKAGKFKGRPKSVDRQRIYIMLDEGLSMRATARECGVSLSTVTRVKQERTVISDTARLQGANEKV